VESFWSKPGSQPLVRFAAFIALLSIARMAFANGSDLPPEIVLQGFLKQDPDRLHLVVRIPLVLLSAFGFPKRGPGYLDLAHIDDKLQEAAAATAQQIQVADDDGPLKATVVKARISPLSDHSFASYPAAIAHVGGPPLPLDTDLFWNQGFFDTDIGYTAPTNSSRLSVRLNVAPELGQRLKFRLQFLPAAGVARTYELPGATGWVPLDPRWYEAAWTFVKAGFANAFSADRFMFLLCLIAPFTRYRSLLAVALALAIMETVTLTAVAEGVVGVSHWLPAVFASSIYFATLLLAIGNLGSPDLRRRWFIAAIIGGLAGFGLGAVQLGLAQFAGEHAVVSTLSFNIGLVIGEVVALSVAFIVLRTLFASMFGGIVGVIIVSTLLGLLAWNRMAEANPELVHELGHAVAEGFQRALPILVWMLPAVVVGALAYFLPPTFGGSRILSLREALLARRDADGRA
jgi:hypothetical protein